LIRFIATFSTEIGWDNGHRGNTMTDFVNDEAARLKAAIAARQVKDQKSVNDAELRRAGGNLFWQQTRTEIQKLLKQLNEQLGSEVFLWQAQQTNQIEAIAPTLSQANYLKGMYRPENFTGQWSVMGRPGGHTEFKMVVVHDSLAWNVQGSTTLTSEQLAERIVKEFSEHLRSL
jgi:hypothetical protein